MFRPRVKNDSMTCSTTVGNVKFNKIGMRSTQCYIGRGSVYGNPYIISNDLTREQCIRKFQDYFYTNVPLMERARRELTGKELLCYCRPQLACHGDVIANVCNMSPDEFSTLCEKHH